ncbi:MAG: hypothetical protein KUG82_22970 [Pseudomonadales bacterium]|nr:hypothetical protein [Pseudomonadales bacterium]
MWQSKLITLINATLLLVSLAAAATWVTWSYSPNAVNQFDTYIITRYTAHYLTKLNAAKDQLKRSPQEGIALVQSLADDISKSVKLDRLDPVKRESFKVIVQHYRGVGESRLEMKWAKKWTEFDPQDLEAQLAYALAFYASKGEKQSGLTPLIKLYSRAPNIEMIQWPLFMVALRHVAIGPIDSDPVDSGPVDSDPMALETTALDIIDALLNRNIGSDSNVNWEVFWDTDQGFQPNNSKKIIPYKGDHNTLSSSLSLPKGTQRIRIDPPPNKAWTLKTIRMEYVFTHHTLENDLLVANTPLSEITLQLNDLERKKDSLRILKGSDPYFFFTTPSDLKNEGAQVSLQMEVERTYSGEIIQFFESSEYHSLLAKLKIKNSRHLISQLAALQRKVSES